MWICKECGEGYFEDCSPYYATCLYCNNSGSSIDEIAYWEEDGDENWRINREDELEDYLTNLWEETLFVLKQYNKSWNDVTNIYGDKFQITKENFEKVAKTTNYDKESGLDYIALDLKITGKDFVMIRNGYNEEYWECYTINEGIPKEFKEINKLMTNEISERNLEEINI